MSRVVFALLAAGNSSRMGCHKGLLQIGALPLLLAHIESVPDNVDKVVIIAGTAHDDYEKLMPDHEQRSRILLIKHPCPRQGQFSSLQHVIRNVNDEFDYLVVSPVDKMPLSEGGWRRIMDELAEKKSVLQLKYKGRGGHPVILHRDFCAMISSLHYEDPLARLDRQIEILPLADKKVLMVNDETICQNFNELTDILPHGLVV